MISCGRAKEHWLGVYHIVTMYLFGDEVLQECFVTAKIVNYLKFLLCASRVLV